MSKIVLCVDDSATMQMVADITFRGTELSYVGARSFDEAMEKLKGGKPALVLADAAIGAKSGYDLCQQIKSDAKFADVPVVIICGNSTPYDAAKGAAVGAEGTLAKPWDTQIMLDKCVEMANQGSQAKPSGAAAPAPAAARPTPAVAVPVAAKPAQPAAAAQAPRSATIMGMPSIKMPGGMPPAGTAAPVAAAPSPRQTVMAAAPMVAPAKPAAPAAAPSPMMARAGSAPVASPAPVAAPAHAAPVVAAPPARAPFVAATPTKRSALVERTLAKMAAQLAEASGLAAGSPELLALVKLSTEVVERVVWEVVPELAEAIIRENLQQLAAKRA